MASLLQYAAAAGDYMPDCDEIHLPDYSWKMVRQKIASDLGVGGNVMSTPISPSGFYNVRSHLLCHHIKVRKSKRFACCHYCLRLKKIIKVSVGSHRQFWDQQFSLHNDWQMRERLVEASHVAKATNPETSHTYMVMMIDSMDHSKSDLPSFIGTPKDVESCETLATHITGVYIPGWKERPVSCYTWHDRFPTGSDSVITIIMMVLCAYSKDHKLPPVLYLHMDNCWRENKNRFVLGIAHLLVQLGVFKSVNLCFLPVGHTHNIVDQVFSRFSIALSKVDVFTVEELHRVCRDAYKSTACSCGKRWEILADKLKEHDRRCDCTKVFVHFEHLDEMACWGPVLRQFLASGVVGISKPRYYRVQRDVKGVVRHHYRQQLQKNSDESQRVTNVHGGCSEVAVTNGALEKDRVVETNLMWMPFNHEGFIMFPRGFPDLSQPGSSIKKVPLKPMDMGKLRVTQTKLQPYLTTESKGWWETTLDRLQAEDTNSCSKCTELRLDQMNHCIFKNDDKDTKKIKRTKKAEADKNLISHLQTDPHDNYPKEHLFPPSRYIWKDGKYSDTQEDRVELLEEEAGLVRALEQQRDVSTETHFVGMVATQRRGGNKKNARPPTLEPGHIVVLNNTAGSALPFYVGEVVTVHPVDDNGHTQIVICEYGYPPTTRNQEKPPSEIGWKAMFRGTENVNVSKAGRKKKYEMKERDEFHDHANCKGSTDAMKPLLKSVCASAVAEYDTAERMLTTQLKPGKKRRSGGRKLRRWVCLSLSSNPRLNWTAPNKRQRTS